MVTPEKLQELGKQIAEDYLDKSIPLNTSLEKVASEYNLNPHQVSRVAESANLKTHLELLKTASDKAYIEFDVANPQRLTQFDVPDNLQTRSDYELSPKLASFQKEASDNTNPEDEGGLLTRNDGKAYH